MSFSATKNGSIASSKQELDGTESPQHDGVEKIEPTPATLPEGVPDGGLRAWTQVLCVFFMVLCTWGVLNSYGIFQTYYKLHLLRHETESTIAWIGSVQQCVMLLVSFGIGPLYDAGYARHLLFGGAFLIVLGLMMASISHTLWQLLLSQGFAIGLGAGMLYVPCLSVLPLYFTKRRALALGLASLGSSIGSIIFPPTFTSLQPKVGFGWTMRTLGFIVLALLAVMLAGVKPKVKATQLRRLFHKSILHDGPFMVFITAYAIAFMAIYIPFVYIQQYAMQVCGTRAGLASYMLVFINVGQLLGRSIPPYVADRKTGPINIQLPMGFAAAVLAFAWIGIRSTAGTIVFCVLYGLCTGTMVALGATIAFSLTSDPRALGTRLGVQTGATGIGVLISYPVAGVLLDKHGWTALQAFTGALMMVSALLMLWARVWKCGMQLVRV